MVNQPVKKKITAFMTIHDPSIHLNRLTRKKNHKSLEDNKKYFSISS
jgi:hypothetical protein